MLNPRSSQFLGYLHSFRGFAIINIVLIHAIVAALVAIQAMNDSNPIAIANEVLFHDSTIYFAVISGLLFSAILKNKGYARFFRSKVKYVLVPYIFLTALFTLFMVMGERENSDTSFLLQYLETFFRNLIYGKASFVFWYIPVLIFLYLVTPILDYVMSLKGIGTVLFAIIALTPLLVSRVQMAFDYILSINTMIYFMGAYAIGMYFGNDLQRRLSWVEKYLYPLLGITIIISAVLLYFHIKGIDMYAFVSLRETGYYIQKVCLTGIFIVMFKKLGNNQPKWLFRVAKDSFAIYFLHGFFVFGAIPLFMFLLGFKAIAPFNTILGSLVLTIFSIGLTMLIVLGLRKLMGKNSRMIIGS